MTRTTNLALLGALALSTLSGAARAQEDFPDFFAILADEQEAYERHVRRTGAGFDLAFGAGPGSSINNEVYLLNGNASIRTINLPPGRVATTAVIGDLDGDQEFDVLVMSHDAGGTGPGQLHVCWSANADPAIDDTFPSLGPGTSPYENGSLELVVPTLGGSPRVLLSDPEYTLPGLPNAGIFVCFDLATRQPAVQFGYQGSYPDAHFGAAIGARDAAQSFGAAFAVTEPGYQGAVGDEGRVWTGDPVSGALWWNIPGPPNTELGKVVGINEHWLYAANGDADDVSTTKTDTGVLLQIDMRNVTGFFQLGDQGEKLGIDVETYDVTSLVVASAQRVTRVPVGSTTPTHEWIYWNTAAAPSDQRTLDVRPVANLADPVVTVRTTVPVGGGQFEHWATQLTTEAELRVDILVLPASIPNVINLLLDSPPNAGGAGAFAFSFDPNPGEVVVPGIEGVLPLQPPSIFLGIAPLDATGLGIFTMNWPAINIAEPFNLLFGAVVLPPFGATQNPRFVNPVWTQIQV